MILPYVCPLSEAVRGNGEGLCTRFEELALAFGRHHFGSSSLRNGQRQAYPITFALQLSADQAVVRIDCGRGLRQVAHLRTDAE